NGPPPPGSSTLSLHDALPIWGSRASGDEEGPLARGQRDRHHVPAHELSSATRLDLAAHAHGLVLEQEARVGAGVDHPGELEELRSEEHTSELQSRENLVCRLL